MRPTTPPSTTFSRAWWLRKCLKIHRNNVNLTCRSHDPGQQLAGVQLQDNMKLGEAEVMTRMSWRTLATQLVKRRLEMPLREA